MCIHVDLKGIRVIEEDDDHVIIEASAGENWHDFVLWTLDQGYGGLENLALIPGKYWHCTYTEYWSLWR